MEQLIAGKRQLTSAGKMSRLMAQRLSDVYRAMIAVDPAHAPFTVNLRKFSVGEVMHMSGFSRDYAEGWCAGNDNARHEIQAAGIKIAEGE